MLGHVRTLFYITISDVHGETKSLFVTSSGVKLPNSSRSQHTNLSPQPTLELFSLEKCRCEMGCKEEMTIFK